jgi:hypothetical protein
MNGALLVFCNVNEDVCIHEVGHAGITLVGCHADCSRN